MKDKITAEDTGKNIVIKGKFYQKRDVENSKYQWIVDSNNRAFILNNKHLIHYSFDNGQEIIVEGFFDVPELWKPVKWQNIIFRETNNPNRKISQPWVDPFDENDFKMSPFIIVEKIKGL